MSIKINKKHLFLQREILKICDGDGTEWERYEACKRLLRWAEAKGIIEGSDFREWIDFITAALDV